MTMAMEKPGVVQLVVKHTNLSPEEAKRIEELSRLLQLIADISQSDVFIDCPLEDSSTALVVAQAQPRTAESLYQSSVVGQYAYAQNEPAVLFALMSGKPVIGSRGISQERIAMQQNVVPIRSDEGKVIGVLIMEQDISEKVEQEKNVERLMESNEQLSETLLQLAMSEGNMQSFLHEGIVLFAPDQRITYVNPRAKQLLDRIGITNVDKGIGVSDVFFPEQDDRLQRFLHQGIVHKELQFGAFVVELKAVSIYREHHTVGGFILLRDISDLKEKEKQLTIQSAVIKEIHHRVKNNLQTVSSLLRLQMRRTNSEEVRRVYRDSMNRINSIALIHEVLAYEGTDSIKFDDVLHRLSRSMISSSANPGQHIDIHIRGDALSFPSDIATTLAMIVNELLQNSVRHAFIDRAEGQIEIACHAIGPIVRLRVADDGCGFDRDKMERSASLGLKITETFVHENLGGHFDIHSDTSGTIVQITFPLSQHLHSSQNDQGEGCG